MCCAARHCTAPRHASLPPPPACPTPSCTQNVMAAVNSLAGPVTFEFRAQQPSAPGGLPAVAGAKTIDPPVVKAPKADKPKADTQNKDNTKQHKQNKEDKQGDGMGGSNPTALRRRALRRMLGQRGQRRGLRQENEDTVNSCDTKWQFEVNTVQDCMGGCRAEQCGLRGADGCAVHGHATALAHLCCPARPAPPCPAPSCADKCKAKVGNKVATTVAPKTQPSPSGAALCCDCHYKRGTVPAPAGAPTPTGGAATSGGTGTATQVMASDPQAGWWPAGTITTPLNVGVCGASGRLHGSRWMGGGGWTGGPYVCLLPRP